MKTLKIGDKIPKFECLDENEKTFKSIDLIGKKLIIFFYPRANTPGCTAEACNLSENYQTLTDLGYNIVGISCDKPKSQKYKLFREKLLKIFIHGFLHLLSFNHKKYKDYEKMLKEEKLIYQSVISKIS